MKLQMSTYSSQTQTQTHTHTHTHSMKLKKDICRRDIKKYSFPHRSVNKWNELSEKIVKHETVHAFKEKLDNRYRDRTP